MEGARAAALLATLLAAPTTGSYPTCSCPSNPLGHDLCQPLAPSRRLEGEQRRDVHVYSDCGGPWESATKAGNSSCDWRQFDFSVVKTIVRMAGHSLQIAAARPPPHRPHPGHAHAAGAAAFRSGHWP